MDKNVRNNPEPGSQPRCGPLHGLVAGLGGKVPETRITRLPVFLLACLIMIVQVFPATAVRSSPAEFCERGAILASSRTGVPISVLKAIMLTETGRQIDGSFKPWPWTVNMEGAGTWFESQESALAYAQAHFDQGARSFDVGCFQINYRWHHEHFASLADMFDPMKNAVYAARFLQTLFNEKGDWDATAGAFHSRTPELADGYSAKFTAFRQSLLHEDTLPLPRIDGPDSPGPTRTAPLSSTAMPRAIRVNTYPLLKGDSAGALGSLMPSGPQGRAVSLFDRDEAG